MRSGMDVFYILVQAHIHVCVCGDEKGATEEKLERRTGQRGKKKSVNLAKKKREKVRSGRGRE